MTAWLTGFVTLLSMATFAGIVWWAWSDRRRQANRESAMLPFALPDEPARPATLHPNERGHE